MDIICRKYNCKYNNHTRCDKKDINIDKHSIRDSFVLDSSKPMPDTSKDMFTKPPVIAPFKHCLNIDIACCADCIHNRQGECYSNGILVNDIHDTAECISYVKK